jgi:predicted  nucleic acid-binding Zn-ribbon protein
MRLALRMDPMLEPLVVLQSCDARRLATEKELRAVPLDLAQVAKAIESEKAAIESERTKLRETELLSKRTEHAIEAAEQKLAKLKGQQLQVKKNEEYQALGREIEAAEQEKARLEEEEIGILYRLDTEREAMRKAEAEHKAAVAELEARAAKVREREATLRDRLAIEEAEVAHARTGISAPLLSIYDRLLKSGKMPAVVPLNGGVCGGCHMRVSAGVTHEARVGGKTTTCDNCGRIVYHAA